MAVENCEVEQLSRPLPAEEMLASEGARLTKAAKCGHVARAWKQLQGLGLLPHDENTVEKVSQKWQTTAPGEPATLPKLTADNVAEILPLNALTSQIGELRRGKAGDSLGWYHEAVIALSARASEQHLFAKQIHCLLQASGSDLALQLMRTSRIIPLRKDAANAVRPVAIPTVLQKVWAMAMLEKVKPHGEPRFHDRQFGIMTRNGSARLCNEVMAYLSKAADKRCMLQLDISNAFGSVDRHFIQEALQDLPSSLQSMIDHWLMHTHHAMVPGKQSYRVAIPTQRGIPQGDPMSAWIFCMSFMHALDQAEQTFKEQYQEHDPDGCSDLKCWGYVDDLTCVIDEHHAVAWLAVLESACAKAGLRLNVQKTQIYLPLQREPLDPALRQIWEMTEDPSGATVCGRPMDDEDIDFGCSTCSLPIGTHSYVQAWLQKRRKQANDKLGRLCKIAQHVDPQQGFLRLAWQLLYHQQASADIHLWRALEWHHVMNDSTASRDTETAAWMLHVDYCDYLTLP